MGTRRYLYFSISSLTSYSPYSDWIFVLPQTCMLICPNALGLCSVSEATRSKGMGVGIAAPGVAERDELLEKWRTLRERPPPNHISRTLLIQILAFEMQAELVWRI